MKITEHKNGAWTTFERNTVSGFYTIKLYSPSGEVRDRVSCDSYSEARTYLKSFNLIAKNS